MGVLRAKPFEFTEESILRDLNRNFLANPKYLINCLFVFGWESDYLAKTKAGYWYEVEVKISVADFKKDFTKKKKHMALKEAMLGMGTMTPNYFFYCVPEDLVEKVKPLVPDYAGLICVSRYGYLNWHKGAPRLHAVKLTDEQLNLVEKFYYNWVEEKRKNREHDQLVRDLRGQIHFLKEEFKAATGYDIRESY